MKKKERNKKMNKKELTCAILPNKVVGEVLSR